MQITTNFNPNDEVSFLKESKIVTSQIHSVKIEVNSKGELEICYFVKIFKSENKLDFNLILVYEEHCFNNREELIAQL